MTQNQNYFFKTLFLESLDYLINEHQAVINNLKPNEENFIF